MITYNELCERYCKIVVWGAGNNFEKFFKGDLKDIAYIVDSNEKLWGQTKKGILINSPESLKEEDFANTVVIICSQFKKEIYDQARRMDIKVDIYCAGEVFLDENYDNKNVVKVPVPIMKDAHRILEGKIALITGGTSGIGYAMAEYFVKCGCKVIITGTNQKKCEDCEEKIGSNNVKSMVLNVRDVSTLDEKIRRAASMFDENKIDILVNSAGVLAHSGFLRMSEEEYDSIMDINLKGTFFMSQAMGKYMIENNIHGHILNVSSSSALRPAWTPYQISKWGIKGFTLGLSDVLLPYGITVNAIAPGPTATPMLGRKENDNLNCRSPIGRFAMTSEIATLAAYMVSDFGDMIVGDTFYITGGSGTISMKD